MDRLTPAQQSAARQSDDRPLAADTAAGRIAEPRSWWARAGDEVAAWFGVIDAQRRRQRDGAVGDHTGLGPQTSVEPDALIVDHVSRRLTDDAELDASRVRVACADGAVSLTGEVTTLADVSRAENLAAATAGVSAVRNHLAVV